MQTVKHNLQHCILYITPTYRYEYSAVAIKFILCTIIECRNRLVSAIRDFQMSLQTRSAF